MRAIALVLLTTAACAPTDPMAGDKPLPEASSSTATNTDTATDECGATNIRTLVGRIADTATQEEARRLSGARGMRVLPPGAIVTMDYRADRLNVRTDAAGKILSLDCG